MYVCSSSTVMKRSLRSRLRLAFLEPRLVQAHRLLTPTGSLFLHLDPREVHYAKVLLRFGFGAGSTGASVR